VSLGYVIAGVGTDVAKTYVAAGILQAWRSRSLSCAAFKPVLSGFSAEDALESDAARLLGALGQTPTIANIERMSPWRFRAPLSPPDAAALEGLDIDFNAVVGACRERLQQGPAPRTLIETAGGIMSPLTRTHTMLDLMAAVAAPVILVTGSYLGAISHTLTAHLALHSRHCDVAALIISQSEASAGDFAALPVILRELGVHQPIFTLRRSSIEQGAGRCQEIVDFLDSRDAGSPNL
jgi:dethiobiotin synthetase